MIKIKEKYEKDQNKIKNGNLVQKLVQLAKTANFTKKMCDHEVYKKFRDRELYKTANFTTCRNKESRTITFFDSTLYTME